MYDHKSDHGVKSGIQHVAIEERQDNLKAIKSNWKSAVSEMKFASKILIEKIKTIDFKIVINM